MIKQDKEIIRLLKVEYIAHPIVNTSKGLLAKVLRKGEDEYHYVLDAVPLSEELNKQIDENLQGEQKRDGFRTPKDYPRVEESRVEVGSPETSERVETNQEEVVLTNVEPEVVKEVMALSQSPVEDLDRELAKETIVTTVSNETV